MAVPPSPPSVSLTVQRRVRALVFITVFLDLVGFGLIIPLLPFYVESMGGSATTAGVLLALFSSAQLLATPVLGRLSDRVGRRPVILLSLLGNALSMFLFAYSTHVRLLPVLFASRLLAGATAGNLAACQAAVADVTEAKSRAEGMGARGAPASAW
ncbi:MFS transporter, partial [Pyxidicoccus sp. 3LG]